jgi:threonine dehydrogenase-like Zn-dependent dehydrogenase
MTMGKGHPAAALVRRGPSGVLLAALARRAGADRVIANTLWRA